MLGGPVPIAAPAQANSVSQARELIRKQRYNDAMTKLEEVLESAPNHAEALSYMGAVYLYNERDFLKAQKFYEQSFRAGGSASFWVSHSHEKLGGNELADYCRGWFYIRKNEVEFVTEESDHGFRLASSEVKELKQNRLARTFFHIKDANRNFNFRPRTGDEGEIWLVLALFKKFSQ